LNNLALHQAAENGNLPAVRFFVEELKADPNDQDSDSLGHTHQKAANFVGGYRPLVGPSKKAILTSSAI
jgi:hypothetical protein